MTGRDTVRLTPALLLTGPGGVARAGALVSVAVALVVRGPVGAALFALVALGLVAPVLGRVPRGLDAAYGVGLLAAAWCGVLGLYESVWWLDEVMHLVVTGLIAAVGHLVVARRTGALVDPAEATSVVLSAGVTTMLGLALSALWEMAEYLGHTYLDPSIYVAYRDTVSDMALGGLGSAVAGVVLAQAAASRRQPAAPER